MRMFVLLAVLPGFVLPSDVAGQYLARPVVPGPERIMLDAFVAGHRPADAVDLARGFGARLLFGLGAPSRGADRSVWERAYLGPFVAYTAGVPTRSGDRHDALTHAGVEADWLVLDRALAGRIDPFLSMGLGVLRTEREERLPTVRDTHRATVRLATRIDKTVEGGTRTNMTVAPGVGARVAVVPGLSLRVDVRDAIAFGTATTHVLEMAFGVSLER